MTTHISNTSKQGISNSVYPVPGSPSLDRSNVLSSKKNLMFTTRRESLNNEKQSVNNNNPLVASHEINVVNKKVLIEDQGTLTP